MDHYASDASDELKGEIPIAVEDTERTSLNFLSEQRGITFFSSFFLIVKSN
jgi:hypothetical protein